MMLSSFTSRWLALAMLLVCWMPAKSRCSTLQWGSSFNDTLLTSTGQTLDASFLFEIGAFANGFVPTYENTSLWQANWKVFDQAVAPAGSGWNVSQQFFVGTAEHLPNGTSDSLAASPLSVFGQGETAYLWVYNSKAIVPGSEWALVTDSSLLGNVANPWVFPDPNDPVGTSYNWQLLDADTAIIGGVNGLQGAGTYSIDPGVFSLQTHVVPEPGSSVLVLLALVAGLMRRCGTFQKKCPE